MSLNPIDRMVSKDTQRIVAKKLSSDQLFVLLVLIISAVLFYFMMDKITARMDAVNFRLDKLIELNQKNLSALKDNLTSDEQKDNI